MVVRNLYSGANMVQYIILRNFIQKISNPVIINKLKAISSHLLSLGDCSCAYHHWKRFQQFGNVDMEYYSSLFPSTYQSLCASGLFLDWWCNLSFNFRKIRCKEPRCNPSYRVTNIDLMWKLSFFRFYPRIAKENIPYQDIPDNLRSEWDYLP